MAKAKLKTSEATVRQYAGTGTFTIMHDKKGELHAKKGDWLIGDEKGKIDVMSNEDFKEQYDLDGDSLSESDQEPQVQKNSPLVDPVWGAAPHHGIIAPDSSSTANTQPTPTVIDDSAVPLNDSTNHEVISTPSRPAVVEPQSDVKQ